MALSEEEVDIVREIADLENTDTETGFDIAKRLTDTLKPAQITRLQPDLAYWSKVRRKTMNLNGDGLLSFADDKLNRIRHFVRVMLGLPPISDVQEAIDENKGNSMDFGVVKMMSGRYPRDRNSEFSG